MGKYASGERQKGIIAIILLAVCYGILALMPRYLINSFALFQQVYLRQAIGFLFLFLLFRRQIDFKKLRTLPLKEWIVVMLRAFIYFFLGVVLFTQSLLMTKISNVTFIGAIPMTALIGFILLKEKFNFQKFFLVLISFLGVIAISVSDFSNITSFGKGEIIALLSAFFISLGLISRKWQSKVLSDRETSILMLFFAALFIFIGSLLKGEGLTATNLQVETVLILVLGGFLNAGVGYLMNYGFSRVDAVLANNLIALEPIFATFFAFLVFSEVPISKEILGGTLIILSAILLHRTEQN